MNTEMYTQPGSSSSGGGGSGGGSSSDSSSINSTSYKRAHEPAGFANASSVHVAKKSRSWDYVRSNQSPSFSHPAALSPVSQPIQVSTLRLYGGTIHKRLVPTQIVAGPLLVLPGQSNERCRSKIIAANHLQLGTDIGVEANRRARAQLQDGNGNGSCSDQVEIRQADADGKMVASVKFYDPPSSFAQKVEPGVDTTASIKNGSSYKPDTIRTPESRDTNRSTLPSPKKVPLEVRRVVSSTEPHPNWSTSGSKARSNVDDTADPATNFACESNSEDSPELSNGRMNIESAISGMPKTNKSESFCLSSKNLTGRPEVDEMKLSDVKAELYSIHPALRTTVLSAERGRALLIEARRAVQEGRSPLPDGCWACLGITYEDKHTCELYVPPKPSQKHVVFECTFCSRLLGYRTGDYCPYCHQKCRPRKVARQQRKDPVKLTSNEPSNPPTERTCAEPWELKMSKVFGWDDACESDTGLRTRKRVHRQFVVKEQFAKLPNFTGTYLCTPYILPNFQKRHGTILNQGGWYKQNSEKIWALSEEETLKRVKNRYAHVSDSSNRRRACKKIPKIQIYPAPERLDMLGHDFDICHLPEIYNGLLLGNAEVASNAHLIRSLGIGAILNMTESDRYLRHCKKTLEKTSTRTKASKSRSLSSFHNKDNNSSKQGQPFVPYYERISIQDTYDTKLFEDYLIRAISFLDRCFLTGTRVLVHCRAGKSRSVTIVLAWAIGRFGMKLSTLLPLIASRRRGLNVNLGFADKLMKLEKVMLGKASVARGAKHRRSSMGKLSTLFNSSSGSK